MTQLAPKGILLVDKAKGSYSFRLVSILRKLTKVEKIGHSGTLDPFATGLMVMLIGRDFTRRSDEFLTSEKEYRATLHLGVATDSYDLDGQVTQRSDHIPSLSDVQHVLQVFQGEILQVPPMFSAKKVEGKKLYDLARKGVTIERQPVLVRVQTTLLRYEYPEIEIQVSCSKGTYIRSLAHDMGQALGSCAHLTALTRLRSGSFRLEDAVPQESLQPGFDLTPYLRLS
jgi:tRNA pseudouridine55 synthase